MRIRVAHIGTGNVGRLALTGVITNPAYELTAVGVSSKAKVGKDAGELAGVGVSTGIAATGELEAVLATEPDCVLYSGEEKLVTERLDELRDAGVDEFVGYPFDTSAEGRVRTRKLLREYGH